MAFMSTTMSVSEARAALPAIIERVLDGEEVTLTRHGVAVAVVVRPDSLRARKADRVLAAAAEVHEVLEAGRRSALRSRTAMTGERADALVDHVRTTRALR